MKSSPNIAALSPNSATIAVIGLYSYPIRPSYSTSPRTVNWDPSASTKIYVTGLRRNGFDLVELWYVDVSIIVQEAQSTKTIMFSSWILMGTCHPDWVFLYLTHEQAYDRGAWPWCNTIGHCGCRAGLARWVNCLFISRNSITWVLINPSKAFPYSFHKAAKHFGKLYKR